MLAEVDWGQVAGMLVLVIGALTTAIATLIPIWHHARRGQEALSEAIEESDQNGGDVRAALRKRTDTDPDLKRHLKKVRAAATERLKKKEQF